MKILVFGATGYTGRAVVAQACAQGHQVVAHVRPDSSTDPRVFEDQGAIVVRAPWQQAAVDALLADQQPDAVFALLGTTRARGKAATKAGRAPETYETVDRDLTLVALRAAERCGSAPRFVYLSSLGADKPRGNAYLRARHQVEASLQRSGLPWTVARPSIITGSDRDESRPAEHLASVVTDGALGLAGLVGARKLRDRLASIDGDTLARGLLAAAADPAHAGVVIDSADLKALAG